MKMILRPGEAPTKWYGTAYYEPDKDQHVAYPIPINMFVALAREAYFWCKYRIFRSTDLMTWEQHHKIVDVIVKENLRRTFMYSDQIVDMQKKIESLEGKDG